MIAILLLDTLLIPGIMLLTGWWMYRHPPKDVNGFIGYRTRRSMRSPEAWAFAQRKYGAFWLRWSWTMMAVSAAVHLPFLRSGMDALLTLSSVVMLAQCVMLVCSVLPVERALKEKFDDNGTAKEHPDGQD